MLFGASVALKTQKSLNQISKCQSSSSSNLMVSIMFIKDSEDGTTAMDEDLKLLARADPAHQESLQSEVEPDPMEGEQTWPTDDELRQAEGEE